MIDSINLKEILDKHLHWIKEDCDGWEYMKADLCGVDLRGADLRGADLRGADLRRADLHEADLRVADLWGADLRGAELCEANLRGADLRGANLRGADLRGADLRGADLRRADLHEADLYEAKIDKKLLDRLFPICCPEYGAFVGWKNAKGLIVKLQIPEDAKRSSAFGRKCRCSKAIVLGIENLDGSDSGLKEIASGFDANFIYRIGETVEVQNFDDDRKNECAPGIHFFITRQEAVDY